MAKHARKVQQALEVRRRIFDAVKAEDRKNMTRPGSQNKKKGWGSNRRRR